MIPLPQFVWPGHGRYTERRNDQHPGDLKAVMDELLDGSQGDDRFAEAHIQENRCNRMRQDELRGKGLIIMGQVLHASLPFSSDVSVYIMYQGHPGSGTDGQ